jgi:1-deoxy-D-xylulose-5-phosphate reductoisomerase
VILGATGSIGRQTIEVAAALSQVSVVGLTADRSVDALLAAAAATGVSEIGLHDRAAAAAAAGRSSCHVRSGDEGVAELIAAAADAAVRAGDELVVLNAIVGAAGLRASLAALEAGATLALANKESMVAGGPFVLAAARVSCPSTASTAQSSSASRAGAGERGGWASRAAAGWPTRRRASLAPRRPWPPRLPATTTLCWPPRRSC